MSKTLQEIMEMVEVFWLDHEPDGWPAIRMDQVTALYHAVLAGEAENERLREQTRWRRCGEEMPDDQQDCIVAFEPDGEFGAANYRDGEWRVDWDANGPEPTFWLPLTPPEAKLPSLQDIYDAGLRKAPDADDVLDELRGRTEAKP